MDANRFQEKWKTTGTEKQKKMKSAEKQKKKMKSDASGFRALGSFERQKAEEKCGNSSINRNAD